MAATANSINAAATSVINTATAALTAINNSTVANKAALQASANAVIAQGNAVAAQIATINKQIAALQAQLLGQTGGPTVDQQKQMNQLAIDLNSARVAANDAITALNNLLSQAAAAGVPNLPTNPNLQPIQPPILASASIPV